MLDMLKKERTASVFLAEMKLQCALNFYLNGKRFISQRIFRLRLSNDLSEG